MEGNAVKVGVLSCDLRVNYKNVPNYLLGTPGRHAKAKYRELPHPNASQISARHEGQRLGIPDAE